MNKTAISVFVIVLGLLVAVGVLTFQISREASPTTRYYKAVEIYHEYMERCQRDDTEPVFEKQYRAIVEIQYKAVMTTSRIPEEVYLFTSVIAVPVLFLFLVK